MQIYQDAIEAGKVAHAAARQARRYPEAIGEARAAAVAHLVAHGGVKLETSGLGGRAPICEGKEIAVEIGGQTVKVMGGYDSNGPRDVWDYLQIWEVVDGKEKTKLATAGRLPA